MDFVEFSGKTVDDALCEALIKLQTTSENIEYEIIEKGSAGFLGFNSKLAKIRAKKKFNIEDAIIEFLEKIFVAMKITVKIDLKYNKEDGIVDIDLSGDEMGVLIGKRGQTLDSLQYLTSLVANKESDKYLKVKMDTENYRERRKETLENLAKNIAYKVKRTKKSVSLEPMNPYERRVIHSVLQNDKYVETHSEGEEPYRRVVVSIKKHNYNKNNNYRNSNYNNNK